MRAPQGDRHGMLLRGRGLRAHPHGLAGGHTLTRNRSPHSNTRMVAKHSYCVTETAQLGSTRVSSRPTIVSANVRFCTAKRPSIAREPEEDLCGLFSPT